MTGRATKIDHSGHFRLSLNSGSIEDIAVGPVRAKSRHRREALTEIVLMFFKSANVVLQCGLNLPDVVSSHPVRKVVGQPSTALQPLFQYHFVPFAIHKVRTASPPEPTQAKAAIRYWCRRFSTDWAETPGEIR
jgi:hypothetical protein